MSKEVFLNSTRTAFSRPYQPMPSRIFLHITGAKKNRQNDKLTDRFVIKNMLGHGKRTLFVKLAELFRYEISTFLKRE